MKIAPLIVASLAGFVLGLAAWLPVRRQLREDLEDARRALEAVGPGILVQSPQEVRIETVTRPSPEPPPPVRAVAPEEAVVVEEPAEAPRLSEGGRFSRDRRGDDPSRDDPEVREARRREFVERLRERSDASRTEFIARAALDETQSNQLDTLVFDLNQSVESIVNDWVAHIRDTGTFDTDYRIRFAHDLSAAVVAAYDAMDETLPATWRGAAEEFDLARMIDPDVLRPMMELQREMGVRPSFLGGLFGGGRGGPPRREGGGETREGRSEGP